MSDADLRELERRFRESGSVEDEAAWLRARLHGGELSEDKLRLAAYLKHPAACQAFDRPSPVLRKGHRAFVVSLFDLSKCKETVVRAVVAAARDVETNSAQSDLLGLKIAEQWCVSLDPESRAALEQEAEAFESHTRNSRASPEHRAAVFSTLAVSNRTKSSLAVGSTARVDVWHMNALLSLSASLESVLGPPRQRLNERPVPPRISVAIRDELVPWLLGYRDPVRERVEARQRAEAASE